MWVGCGVKRYTRLAAENACLINSDFCVEVGGKMVVVSTTLGPKRRQLLNAVLSACVSV